MLSNHLPLTTCSSIPPLLLWQVQSTIIPVVLMLHVEDLTNISAAEKRKLISMFDAMGLPHIVCETHFIISSDLQHDNAMIQKLFDDKIIPYILKNAPSVTSLHVRSDGCKAQFKCAANFMWVSKQSSEGCGLTIDWSFFESCHGKCYCDPEGGTLKNAARRHELKGGLKDFIKDASMLYVWVRDKSGLETPTKQLAEKKGRGIYRRFFYFIPSKGTGAVDRSRLPTLNADGTSKLHEFIDIGVAGKVSTRLNACHQCDNCWAGNRYDCDNKAYTGLPASLLISVKAVPAAAAARIERAERNRKGIELAKTADIKDVVCIETHQDEQTFPWVLGKVISKLHVSAVALPAHDPSKDPVHFEPVRVNDDVLKVMLYEALDPGSTTYTLSNITMLVPARRVRVPKVELFGVRNIREVASNLPAARFKIDEDSLLKIRAEMPTSSDDWEAESVAQYRIQYGVEQWLIKWQGYGEDRNTWEPWENLLTDEVQADARTAKDKALPSVAKKLTVPLLKQAL